MRIFDVHRSIDCFDTPVQFLFCQVSCFLYFSFPLSLQGLVCSIAISLWVMQIGWNAVEDWPLFLSIIMLLLLCGLFCICCRGFHVVCLPLVIFTASVAMGPFVKKIMPSFPPCYGLVWLALSIQQIIIENKIRRTITFTRPTAYERREVFARLCQKK